MRSTRRARILYIEDHLTSARLVQARLQQEGYTVDVARDGTDGLALLEKQQYDLILLDPHVPMQGGLNIVQNLTSRPSAPPVLIVEEQHNVQAAALTIKLGASDYLFQGRLEEHLQLLPQVIARTLEKRGLELEREQTLQELRQDNRDLTLLTRVAQLLTSTLNFNEVISQLVRVITEIVVTEGSSVWHCGLGGYPAADGQRGRCDDRRALCRSDRYQNRLHYEIDFGGAADYPQPGDRCTGTGEQISRPF
jgi:DNA-binding NtrC family response regulator